MYCGLPLAKEEFESMFHTCFFMHELQQVVSIVGEHSEAFQACETGVCRASKSQTTVLSSAVEKVVCQCLILNGLDIHQQSLTESLIS